MVEPSRRDQWLCHHRLTGGWEASVGQLGAAVNGRFAKVAEDAVAFLKDGHRLSPKRP
jgi:hypothetical protein